MSSATRSRGPSVRVGVSSYWFNRGQGVVGRQLRSALETLGHETFVLARPTRDTNIKPSFVDDAGVWDQQGVTVASSYEIPGEEMLAWGRDNSLDAALFDQNYQFDGDLGAPRSRRPHLRAVRLGALRRRARRVRPAKPSPPSTR